MKKSAALGIGFILLLAGCATTSPRQSFEVSAKELGIAYYYPKARLQVVPQAKNKYTVTLIPGPFATPWAAQDGSLITGFYATGFFCPVWRLAKSAGATAAILSFPNPANTEAAVAEVTLAEAPASAPTAVGEERIEVLNFADESWRSIQQTWCEQPEKLNRSWKK